MLFLFSPASSIHPIKSRQMLIGNKSREGKFFRLQDSTSYGDKNHGFIINPSNDSP
jgi:hypothetical protein